MSYSHSHCPARSLALIICERSVGSIRRPRAEWGGCVLNAPIALLRFAAEMKLVVLLLVLIASGACDRPAPPAPMEADASGSRPRLGLWVLAQGSHRTLEDPAKVTRLVADAISLGATDLFVQVYRAGRSWYPSRQADDTPYARTQTATGPAGLRRLIDAAHAEGLQVHAWFNALSLHRNREAPLLASLGPAAVLVDRKGRNLLDYPDFEVPQPDRRHTRMGTPGIFLDPAAEGVIDYLVASVAELVAAAPDLDGLHLDFIRHPLSLPIVPGSRFDGLDFGYGKHAVAAFEAARGRRFARGSDWDDFRRERVHDLVKALHAEIPESWAYSAAVLPWADRAYQSAMQDWRRWLEEGSLDFAVAMLYTRDDRLLRYVADSLVGGTSGERVWLGLGSWLFLDDAPRMQHQLDLAAARAPAGVALFSYDSLADKPGALAALHWPSNP